MKNFRRGFVALMACLVASTGLAGVIFVPVGNVVIQGLDGASVLIDNGPKSTLRIRTSGIAGRLSEAPGATGPEGSYIAFVQQQELVVDINSNRAEGRARGTLTLSISGEQLSYQADVDGSATCVPRGSSDCDQLIVNIDLRGVIADPDDPQRIGIIRMEMLGSLVRAGQDARWTALDANVSLGGNESLIQQILDTMDDAETTGV